MSNTLNKINKYIVDKDYRFVVNSNMHLYDHLSDEEYLKRKYKAVFGKELDLINPKEYNEKLQWLKLHERKNEYTEFVDKFKVREYVKKVIGEEYLIPLIGVWDKPEEIDFSSLPNEFVLKCNHNSGLGMCICTNKEKLNIKDVVKKLNKGIKQNYYLLGREWPYKNVKRKIICEKYMVDNETKELRDYKFFCFNGEVKFVMINTNRNSSSNITTADYFDKEFNWLDFTWGYSHATSKPKKPIKYDEMIKIAEKLSKNITHVRVDLYECNDRIYFGEMTFFDGSGFDEIKPIEWSYKIGEYIDINI